jgi:uncharacterized protein YndB with AHSA1/START domain
MIKVDYHVPIRRSPAEVYDYVTDVERIPEVAAPGRVRRVTKHDAGPLQVGSRFTMEREARGSVATIDATVTALEPDVDSTSTPSTTTGSSATSRRR